MAAVLCATVSYDLCQAIGSIGIDDSAAGKTFISAAANDVITLNGSTKGGLAGSIIKCTVMADDKYHVEAQLLGSGTLVTPFANS